MTKKLFMLIVLLTLFTATEGVKAQQDVSASLDKFRNANNQRDRIRAKEELVNKHGTSALDGLINIFQSIPKDDDELKLSAAIAIGQIVQIAINNNSPDQATKNNWQKVFEEMLATKRQAIRYWGFKGLILLKAPNIKDIILKEYKGKSSFSKWMLLGWLKDLDAPELVDIAIGIVSDQNSRFDFVVKAIMILKDKAKDKTKVAKIKKAVKPIMEQRFLRKDQPFFIKRAAADIIHDLTGTDFRFPAKPTKDGAAEQSAIDSAQKWWDAHKNDPEYQ